MKVTVDLLKGSVYVEIHESPHELVSTRQFDKFGIELVWDGHGSLCGINFAGDGSVVDVDVVDQKEYADHHGHIL